MCLCWHRLKSMSEHKLHSDIKVWVAISEFPMATISYGPALAQVLACWKKSTVSVSMQIYAEYKYVLEETSVVFLLVGGVSYPPQPPFLGLGGGGSPPTLSALEEVIYFSIVLLCTINAVLLREDIAQPQQFHHYNIWSTWTN